jgi:Fe-Mn family superoxide dismutase
MTFKLPELPFSMEAFGNRMSKETFEYHHGKHHAAYVNNLNKLIIGTEFENMSIEDIVKRAPQGPIYNNAAQVWNHTFFWHTLNAGKIKNPSGTLLEAIKKQYGTVEDFRQKFVAAAMGQFGSGWAWLVKNNDGSLGIETTSNAITPLAAGKTPLMTCDVWEHAYYIDYRNNRQKYVETFWEMINWDFVAKNFG